jgi:hypothetical protein
MSDDERKPKKPEEPYDYWKDPEHQPMPDMSAVSRGAWWRGGF